MTTPDDRSRLALSALRQKLAGRTGRSFWRSLDEIAETPEFRRFLEAEYPAVAALVLPETSRRSLLKAMAASLLLGGLAACGDTPPREAIPYVNQPEHLIPGVPRYYATAVLFEGYAQPVLAETHVGRPTKLEGNPDHPLTRGGTDPFLQAEVLTFYDPDRSQAVTDHGRIASWLALHRQLDTLRARLDATGGAGTRLLTGAVTSPTLIRQIAALQQRWPELQWHGFEPVGPARRGAATERAFGRPLAPLYRLNQAAVIVSLEDDPLGPGPHQIAYSRAWSERRRQTRGGPDITRLHVAESTPSLTGAMALSRRPVAASRIPLLAAGCATRLGIAAGTPGVALSPEEERWVGMAAQSLRRAAGRSLLAVGAHQPPEVQALGFAVNQALGNVGSTVDYIAPVALPAEPADGLAALAADIVAGRVETLIVLDANPVYAAPADLDFARLIQTVPLRLHAGLFYDETAAHCHWHAPMAHPLEMWGDARAVDGTATILQPTAAPLYDSRSPAELLALLLTGLETDGQAIVRETWRETFGETGFEEGWRSALQTGFVPGTAFPPQTAAPRPVEPTLPAAAPAPQAASGLAVELVFRPDPTIWDGRYANNAWLQETPKPHTKLTWDNIAALSPALAERLGVVNGDVVALEAGGRRVQAPAWVMPGQAEGTVTVFLGYGRPGAGRVGTGAGYNAYALRRSDAPWTVPAANLQRTGEDHPLASPQTHRTVEGFDIVRVATPAEAGAPLRPTPELPAQPSLYRPFAYPDHAWSMVVDTDTCIGCNACVVACQAENNVPVVGKEEVIIGREMHWLRVDTYFGGDPMTPDVVFMPVPCMHCEKAPCELGCPVNATVHGPDGVNEMVYNRCVGTRTCEVYCPYKVRRFNFYEYSRTTEPSLQALYNPDVTVRARGVMEKCTYCIQRIAAARIAAGREDRPIRDGEVVTACQEACPTGAIVFGDMNDPEAAVTRLKRNPTNYALLFHLGTRPRTTYLPRVRPDEPEQEA